MTKRLSPADVISKPVSKARAKKRHKARAKAGLTKSENLVPQKFTEEQQLYIAWLIATYHKPKEAALSFAERYGDTPQLTNTDYKRYLETNKWQPIISELRTKYLSDMDSLPLTHKKIRIMELIRLYEEIQPVPDDVLMLPVKDEFGNYMTDEDGKYMRAPYVKYKKDIGQASSILKQIAEEMNDLRGGSGIFIGDDNVINVSIVRKDKGAEATASPREG